MSGACFLKRFECNLFQFFNRGGREEGTESAESHMIILCVLRAFSVPSAVITSAGFREENSERLHSIHFPVIKMRSEKAIWKRRLN